MSIYASSASVFNFYRDVDGVFVCELTPGMVRELHSLLEDATTSAHQKGRWVPSPCVALTKQLENATRQLGRSGPAPRLAAPEASDPTT